MTNSALNSNSRNPLLNDGVILTLILLNALVIFLSGFSFPSNTTKSLEILDYIFTIIFALEMLAKVRQFGMKGYFSSGWNFFDCFLVLLSLPSLLLIFLPASGKFDLSFLLVLRTARVFKLFRFFTFIDGIEDLVNGIKRTFRASIIVIVSFWLFIFIVSILANNLFGDSEPFGDPGNSLYTTFKIFTVEGWNEIPDLLTPGKSMGTVFLIRIFFILVLLAGGIFGLSFVNAVLVDAMVADNNDALKKKVSDLHSELKEIKELIIHNNSANTPPNN